MGKTSGNPSFITALLAGAAAGTAVDITLFPLDTIKTRLQSSAGFWKSGGFRRMYAGLGSVAAGSAPNAAAFFCAYELSKSVFSPYVEAQFQPLVHMGAATVGEVVACIIRVPVEVVKQRAQAFPGESSWSVLRSTIKGEGARGLYRGYMVTLLREIPFSLIEYPLWEYFKLTWSAYQGKYVDSWQSAICGAMAGGIAAALTTPLDVAKTRIILAERSSDVAKGNIGPVLRQIARQEGMTGLFAGVVPRSLWISVGGAVFFGVYEKAKRFLSTYVD